MSHVVTLIANPAMPILDGDAVSDAQTALRAMGLEPGTPVWLQDGVACDLPCAAPPPNAETALHAALSARPIDIAIQPAADRRKRLLIADMDSTMIQVECIDEMAALLGIKDAVAAITERAMRGEIAFEAALKERVALLKGLDAARLEEVYRERITFTPGASALVHTMRAHGAFTALVSGGFTFFTERVSKALGFHWHQANILEVTPDGLLTGTVAEPVLGRDAKRAALDALCTEHSLPASAVLAVGDGANDLAMLEAAGLGVAFRAKPAVATQADIRITHEDLTALLYLQGYKGADVIGVR